MNKTVNKMLALLLALTLLACCAAQAEPAQAPETHTVTGNTYPYLRQLDTE